MIDALLLDFGNVLVHWDPYLAYEGHMDREAVDAFFADIGFADMNKLQDAGRPWSVARELVGTSHPQHLPAFDFYLENFAATLAGPVEGSAELVAELRGLGLRLYGLTNWSAETFQHAAVAAPATTLLDDVVVSGSVGLAKPDPRIFTLAIDRCGLNPATTLFVDDVPANTAVAAECGLQTHLFTSTDELRADLIARGIAVGAH